MPQEFNIDKARQKLHDATQKHQESLHGLFCQAAADAEKIITHIANNYKPARIWQWGSLLDEASFAEYSDIDIAVEGITDAEAYFAIYGDVMKMTAFPLDLVQLEKIEPEFSQIIRDKGKVVYEKP